MACGPGLSRAIPRTGRILSVIPLPCRTGRANQPCTDRRLSCGKCLRSRPWHQSPDRPQQCFCPSSLSHIVGTAELLAYAQGPGQSPPAALVTIGTACHEVGTELSGPVRDSIPKAVKMIRQWLEEQEGTSAIVANPPDFRINFVVLITVSALVCCRYHTRPGILQIRDSRSAPVRRYPLSGRKPWLA